MDALKAPTKFDLLYAESRVIFIICDCSLDKRYSFWNLNREQAKKFIEKLRRIEKLTWRQFGALPRENGITSEKPDSDSFAMIDVQNTSESKMSGEKYYFHFRIELDGKFRVFGYQRGQFFSITHIDCRGDIHHS